MGGFPRFPPMHVKACDVSAVSYPGLHPSVALHGVLPVLLCYDLTMFFFVPAEPAGRSENTMRGTFVVMACLAVTGNISHRPCAIEKLDCCRQQSQVTEKVATGLPSLGITTVPGSVSQSKHIGYIRTSIAHAPV